MNVPPPPYSETDSNAPSNLILTPATSIGDHLSQSGSIHHGLVDNDHAASLPSSAAAYFESRPVPRYYSGPPTVHDISITTSTKSTDLPFPEPAQAFLAKDITHQDWLTFVNYVLPDHPSSVSNDVTPGSVKEDSTAERMQRLALDPNAPESPLSLDQARAVEAIVRFWNEQFFKLRGVQIRLTTSEPVAPQTETPQREAPQREAPQPEVPQGGASSTNVPQQQWGFGGIGVHSQGVRIGPIRADNKGFRLGTNALVADSNGFRLGQNGLVADSNGFRLGNLLVANSDGFRLGGFTANRQGVKLGGWGVGKTQTPTENGEASRSQEYPNEKGTPHEGPHVKYEGEGSVLDRGRSQTNSNHSAHRDRSSSTSSSSSSSSSSSDSSEDEPATKGDLSGTKKELRDLKRAHKKAKRQAKKERKAAKRAAKKQRRKEKRESKRAVKAARNSHAVPPCPPPPLPTHLPGLATGIIHNALATAHPLDHRYDPTSLAADALRQHARDLEHEALVKETVSSGIRAAATAAGLSEGERAGRMAEASAGYEVAEALRREVEKLRAEAAHLDRELAGGHGLG